MSGGQGMQRSQRKDVGRVWIEDEEGNLKPLMVRIGVTDNTFTEVVRGELEEGQEVITGEDQGDGGDSSNSNQAMRRGMFMMRR